MYAKNYRMNLLTILTGSLLLMGASETSAQTAPIPVLEQVAEIEPIHTEPTSQLEQPEQLELPEQLKLPAEQGQLAQSAPLFVPAIPMTERINESLVRAAGNHAVLMSRVNRIPAEVISSPEHMNETMDGLLQVFSSSLGPALIGYGALIGAQNSDFVEGVLQTAKNEGVDSVVYQLSVNPNYALSLPGALTATLDIQTSWAGDIASIDHSSEHIKKQSYSMQSQAHWKKKLADSRPKRLQIIGQAKSLQFVPPEATAQKIAEVGTIRAQDVSGLLKRQQFWQAYGRKEQPHSENTSVNYIGVMQRKALTLSALEILGATGVESSEWIEKYMDSPHLTRCVATARLNTEQCVAAVHFKYEDAFCIAAHELKEISTCMSNNAL